LKMRIDIVTGFPRIIQQPLNESILKLGQTKGSVEFRVHDLRDYTDDKHRTIDDYPYGGGPGMVLKIEPFVRCMEHLADTSNLEEAQIILPSPRGKLFEQKTATKLCLSTHLIFLCGHYKGIDERIHEFFEIEEISLGDFVISSGEIASLVIIDSLVRLLPGVIKDINSAWTDSFTDDLLDTPYYTRPEEFRGKKVPEILLSGNHKKIEEWRSSQSENSTRDRRPDLYKKYSKTK